MTKYPVITHGLEELKLRHRSKVLPNHLAAGNTKNTRLLGDVGLDRGPVSEEVVLVGGRNVRSNGDDVRHVGGWMV